MAKSKVKKVSRKSAKKNSLVKNINSKRSKTTVFVNVIAILVYIYAAFAILFGVVFFFIGLIGSGAYSQEISQALSTTVNTPIDTFIIQLLLTSLVLAGLFFIVLGVAGIFVGRGLWRKQNWARVTMIVLMTISFILAFLVQDIISLIISGLIGGYLVFNKDVRKAFS